MWLIGQILCVIGAMCGYVFLWKAIQSGQIFEQWYNVLSWISGKGYVKIAMFLGMCEMCFAHFISWAMYIVNIAAMWDIWPIQGWVNIPYALVFVAITWRVCITQIKYLD